jgi:hypothetical protein
MRTFGWCYKCRRFKWVTARPQVGIAHGLCDDCQAEMDKR